jgi:hypothetical protein
VKDEWITPCSVHASLLFFAPSLFTELPFCVDTQSNNFPAPLVRVWAGQGRKAQLVTVLHSCAKAQLVTVGKNTYLALTVFKLLV